MNDSESVQKEYVLEYILDTLNDLIVSKEVVHGAKYHHNTPYKTAASICEHGILTMNDLEKLGISKYSKDILFKMADHESHVNGIDAVSLSVHGLSDLSKDEDEYNPFNPHNVDFLISNDIQVRRSTTHYGNEFLSFGSIDNTLIKSIDIRILKLIKQVNLNDVNEEKQIKSIIEKYNHLREISKVLKDNNLDIPFREVTNSNKNLIDTDKLASTPKLVLKKRV